MTRVAGADRYATSAAVAELGRVLVFGGPAAVSDASLATIRTAAG